MRRFSYRPYGLLVVAVVLMMSFSAEGLRSVAVAAAAPVWRAAKALKGSSAPSELETLRQENHNLRAQVALLKQYFASEGYLKELQERLERFKLEDGFSKRRASELLRLVELQARAVTARVIFREPASWSSSLWINVGEKNNRLLGAKIVAKNSPVVVGASVVGVIEHVGQRKSRVRLITDSGLPISVRAVREEAGVPLYLAKGEVFGASEPLWRSRGVDLKGVGFNYDFPDEEGPARHPDSEIPLLKMGDTLVTTGLDGVFPAGLCVGAVTQVNPLREGSSAYDIKVKAAIANLDDLSFVTLFSPLEENSEIP